MMPDVWVVAPAPLCRLTCSLDQPLGRRGHPPDFPRSPRHRPTWLAVVSPVFVVMTGTSTLPSLRRQIAQSLPDALDLSLRR